MTLSFSLLESFRLSVVLSVLTCWSGLDQGTSRWEGLFDTFYDDNPVIEGIWGGIPGLTEGP